MDSEWRKFTLGEVTNWMSGGTPKKDVPAFWNGDIPWISANSMYGNRFYESDLCITQAGLDNGSRLAPKDSVLLLVRGGALHNRIPVGIATCDVAFNQDVKAVIAKQDNIISWYLLFWFMGQEKLLLNSVVELTGIGAGKLDTKRMQGLEILLPPLSEQVEIVAFIKAIDDRITLLRETNATLESIAQALFKSWFVDFDPVLAKMEGREPEGMDADTAALFPDDFEESELGLAPRGWKAVNIGHIAEVIDCLHSKKPELLKDGRPFLQLNNIRNDGLLETSELACISDEDYKKWISRIEVCGGDCVITNVGRVGAVSQIPAGFRAAMGRNMTAIRLKNECPYPTYLIELLQSAWMKAEIERKTDSGTILNALNVKNIPRLRCVVAPHAVMMAFESITRPLRRAMEENIKQLQILSTLRDILLPRLISGQLRLPEAEAAMEAVLA